MTEFGLPALYADEWRAPSPKLPGIPFIAAVQPASSSPHALWADKWATKLSHQALTRILSLPLLYTAIGAFIVKLLQESSVTQDQLKPLTAIEVVVALGFGGLLAVWAYEDFLYYKKHVRMCADRGWLNKV